MVQEKCAYKACGKTFAKKRKDKKYCSRRCKNRASDLKNKRTSNRIKRLRKNHPSKVWVYRKHLKDRCEICGFIPIHICQLDIDHIDGNHKNNDPENLRTTCANCHRLKTFINKDWEKK